MTIDYEFYNPGGSPANVEVRPNCCLNPHPQLLFLGRDEWMVDCTNCASNLVAIKVTEPVVGGQPEDLESPHVASGHYIEDEDAYPDEHWESEATSPAGSVPLED